MYIVIFVSIFVHWIPLKEGGGAIYWQFFASKVAKSPSNMILLILLWFLGGREWYRNANNKKRWRNTCLVPYALCCKITHLYHSFCSAFDIHFTIFKKHNESESWIWDEDKLSTQRQQNILCWDYMKHSIHWLYPMDIYLYFYTKYCFIYFIHDWISAVCFLMFLLIICFACYIVAFTAIRFKCQMLVLHLTL